jgi:hypothetical protein
MLVAGLVMGTVDLVFQGAGTIAQSRGTVEDRASTGSV